MFLHLNWVYFLAKVVFSLYIQENSPRNNEVVTFLVKYRGNFKTIKFVIQLPVLVALKSELLQVQTSWPVQKLPVCRLNPPLSKSKVLLRTFFNLAPWNSDSHDMTTPSWHSKPFCPFFLKLRKAFAETYKNDLHCQIACMLSVSITTFSLLRDDISRKIFIIKYVFSF